MDPTSFSSIQPPPALEKLDEKKALNLLSYSHLFLKYGPKEDPRLRLTQIEGAQNAYTAYEKNTSLFWKIFNKIIPFKTDRDKIQSLFNKIEKYKESPSALQKQAIKLGYLGESDQSKALRYLDRLYIAYIDYLRLQGGVPDDLKTKTFFGSKIDRIKVLKHLEEFKFDQEQIDFILNHEEIRERNALIDCLSKDPFFDPIDIKHVRKAVQTNNKHILHLAQQSGCSLSANSEGTTLLHEAIQLNQKEIVHFLLMEGVDTHKTDKQGRTAADLAWLEGKSDLFKEIVEQGGHVSYDLLQLPLFEERFFDGDFLLLTPDLIYVTDYDDMLRVLLKSILTLDFDPAQMNPQVKARWDRVIQKAKDENDTELLQAIDGKKL